jgi:hypothetical protein
MMKPILRGRISQVEAAVVIGNEFSVLINTYRLRITKNHLWVVIQYVNAFLEMFRVDKIIRAVPSEILPSRQFKDSIEVPRGSTVFRGPVVSDSSIPACVISAYHFRPVVGCIVGNDQLVIIKSLG